MILAHTLERTIGIQDVRSAGESPRAVMAKSINDYELVRMNFIGYLAQRLEVT
jgi:hypothetical protein